MTVVRSRVQFHIRAYCVASGALTLYLFTKSLALFAAEPYTPPSASLYTDVDLRLHLTNTSLQTETGDENVRLFEELVGSTVIIDGHASKRLSAAEISDINEQMAFVLAEVFKAGIAVPVHFQVILPRDMQHIHH